MLIYKIYKIVYAIYDIYISAYSNLTNYYSIKIRVKYQNKTPLSLNHT